MWWRIAFVYPLLFSGLYLLYNRCRFYNKALYYVRECSHETSFERLQSHTGLSAAIDRIKSRNITSIGFVLLNRHALTITLNWLCNVQVFASVTEKLLVIAFDEVTRRTISKAYPNVETVLVDVPCLHSKFTPYTGPYQLFMVFRAALSYTLLKSGLNIWSLQGDTLWTGDLFSMAQQRFNIGSGHIWADQETDESESKGLTTKTMPGGYFYAKSGPETLAFFHDVHEVLYWYFVPDCLYMTALCDLKSNGVQCNFFPVSFISNWRWHTNQRDFVPTLLQFDGGEECGGKVALLKKSGLFFLKTVTSTNGEEELVCDRNRVTDALQSITVEKLRRKDGKTSYLLLYITAIYDILDLLCTVMPCFKSFVKDYLNVYYAYTNFQAGD